MIALMHWFTKKPLRKGKPSAKFETTKSETPKAEILKVKTCQPKLQKPVASTICTETLRSTKPFQFKSTLKVFLFFIESEDSGETQIEIY